MARLDGGGAAGWPVRLLSGAGGGASEKDAKLAQKLGQLQSFLSGYHRNVWANTHLLGQPNAFLAQIDCIGFWGAWSECSVDLGLYPIVTLEKQLPNMIVNMV